MFVKPIIDDEDFYELLKTKKLVNQIEDLTDEEYRELQNVVLSTINKAFDLINIVKQAVSSQESSKYFLSVIKTQIIKFINDPSNSAMYLRDCAYELSNMIDKSIDEENGTMNYDLLKTNLYEVEVYINEIKDAFFKNSLSKDILVRLIVDNKVNLADVRVTQKNNVCDLYKELVNIYNYYLINPVEVDPTEFLSSFVKHYYPLYQSRLRDDSRTYERFIEFYDKLREDNASIYSNREAIDKLRYDVSDLKLHIDKYASEEYDSKLSSVLDRVRALVTNESVNYGYAQSRLDDFKKRIDRIQKNKRLRKKRYFVADLLYDVREHLRDLDDFLETRMRNIIITEISKYIEDSPYFKYITDNDIFILSSMKVEEPSLFKMYCNAIKAQLFVTCLEDSCSNLEKDGKEYPLNKDMGYYVCLISDLVEVASTYEDYTTYIKEHDTFELYMSYIVNGDILSEQQVIDSIIENVESTEVKKEVQKLTQKQNG